MVNWNLLFTNRWNRKMMAVMMMAITATAEAKWVSPPVSLMKEL